MFRRLRAVEVFQEDTRIACHTIQAAMWPIGRKAVAIHKSRYPSPTTIPPVWPAQPRNSRVF